MNERIRKLTADKVASRSLGIAIVAIGCTCAYLLFSYFKLPPYVPLFNQATWGTDRLALRVLLLLPIGLAICIFVVNLVLAASLYERIPLLSRMLTIITFLMSILLFIYYFRTIHLII